MEDQVDGEEVRMTMSRLSRMLRVSSFGAFWRQAEKAEMTWLPYTWVMRSRSVDSFDQRRSVNDSPP